MRDTRDFEQSWKVLSSYYIMKKENWMSQLWGKNDKQLRFKRL